MKAIVTASAEFSILENGIAISNNQALGYATWERYLNVYDKVILFVRTRAAISDTNSGAIVTGPGVEIYACPHYKGPWQFARRALRIKKEIRRILQEDAAIHLRLPCPVGFLVVKKIRRKRPYGVEVVGDPWDVFSPGAVKHILRPFLRYYYSYKLRKACQGAVAASYVTKKLLQQRYPCPQAMYSAPNVQLMFGDMVDKPRVFNKSQSRSIVFCGSLAQLYKSPDVLIKAFAKCLESMPGMRLYILGDGKYRTLLEELAQSLGVEDKVFFLGMVSRMEVFRKLDEADLFVLPSRTEGLPKAMLEAMARGLPCIGSTVGGIPELLEPQDMVPPNDEDALAKKIIEVISDVDRMNAMSARNLEKAKEYREDILQKKREEFYKYLKERTEEWLASKNEFRK